MTASKLALMAAALVSLANCAHKEMTGEDHRAAAAADLAAADRSKAKFDPGQTAMAINAPRGAGFVDDPFTPPRFYNPSASNLVEADRKMNSAYQHLEAARKLEKYEDVACAGLTVAERTSCPLIAPHLEKIEEGRRGVVLHLKSGEKAKSLSSQLGCHLAFSKASNFERAPCPLFIKGVAINLVGGKSIEFTSDDPAVARAVREEARKMFGEPANNVSAR